VDSDARPEDVHGGDSLIFYKMKAHTLQCSKML
jgi:hypothetical protein